MGCNRSWKALTAVVAMVASPALAIGQSAAPVVAILYFDNNSFGKDRAEYDGLGKGIADLLINDMASNTSLRVVERDRIQSVLQEQDLIKSKRIDPETAVRLGRILGAQYMIAGGLINDGKGNLVLTSRVISVETSAITNPVKVQAKSDDVLGLIAQLSAKLNSQLKLAPLPGQPANARDGRAPKPAAAGTPETKRSREQTDTGGARRGAAWQTPKSTKLDVRTALLYSKALDEQDSGNPARAAELYRAVLQRFPEFGPARANLAKVEKSGA